MFIKKKLLKLVKVFVKSTIETEFAYKLSTPAIVLIQTLNCLLPFSYSVLPLNQDSNASKYFSLMAYIIRPYILLQNYSQNLSYLIFALTILVLASTIILAYKKQNKVQSFLNIFLCCYSQLFDTYLVNVQLDLLDKEFLSLFTYGLIIIIYLYKTTILKQLVLVCNLNQNTTTVYTIFANIITLLQISTKYTENFQNALIFQQLLSILLCSFQLVNIVYYGVYYNHKMFKISLAIYLNIILYNIMIVLREIGQFDSKVCEIVFILTLPISFRFIQQYFFLSMIKSFKSTQNVHSIMMIVYLKNDYQFSRQRIIIEQLITKRIQSVTIPDRKTDIDDEEMNQFIIQRINKIDNVQMRLSLLCMFKQTHDVFIFFGQKHKFSYITDLRMRIIYEQNKENFEQFLSEQNYKDSQEIQRSAQQFIESEKVNLTLVYKITDLIKKKIEFNNHLLQKQINTEKVYDKAYKLAKDLDLLILNLHEMYHRIPSSKLQCVMAFIYAEVMNDYLAANKMFSIITHVDYQGSRIDLFSNKIAYLTVDLQEIKIKQQHFLDFFEVKNLQMETLIPKCIQSQHKKWIDVFLKTGQSKFLRNFAENFFINDRCFLTTTNFFFEPDFTKGFNVVCFFQKIEDTSPIILIDDNKTIQGMSREFFQLVGIAATDITALVGLPIEIIMPNFVHFEHDQSSQQLIFRFLNTEKYQEFEIFMANYGRKKPSQDLIEGCWMDQSTLDYYNCNCQIINRENTYSIIKLNYLRRNQKGQSLSNTFASSIKYPNSVYEEDIELDYPYEESERNNEIIIIKPDQLLSNRESFNGTLLANNHEQSNTQIIQLKQDRPQQQYFAHVELEQSDSKVQDDGAIDNDNQSQISLVSGAKKSFYYKKYVIIEKLIQSKKKNQNHYTFNLILVLFFIVTIISQLISFFHSYNSFNQYLTDIDLLQIKNYLFQPVEAFIVTRYTIINYNAQFTAKNITASQLAQLLVYPNSNLNLGFDDVQVNLGQILDRLTLQDFLEQTLGVYIYKLTDVGELYNISMREVLVILLNYQYTFKAAYIYDGKTVSDSPYIFYSYRNLIPLYNAFDGLNEILYQETQNRTQNEMDTVLSLYLPFIFITLTLMIICYFIFLKIQDLFENILGLIYYSEIYTIDQDNQRYKYLIEQLNSNSQIIFKYQFSIEKKEASLKQQQKKVQEIIAQKRLQFEKSRLSPYLIIIWLSIPLGIFILFSTYSYYIQFSYLQNYKPTAQFYFLMANLGTNIPTIYAMREVLYYRWRYPFYVQSDLDQILTQINECLNQTKYTTSYLTGISQNTYLLSKNFTQHMQSIQEENICNFQTPEFYQKSLNLCNITLGGSFQKGLQGALVYIFTSITNEMQINNFYNKTSATYQELEGAFMISEIIKEINKFMKSDFTTITQYILDNIKVLFIVYILYVTAGLVLLYFYISPQMTMSYYIVKRFIYLVPQQTLFLDDSFERLSKSIIQSLF